MGAKRQQTLEMKTESEVREQEEPATDAAQAFEALRAEVANEHPSQGISAPHMDNGRYPVVRATRRLPAFVSHPHFK